MDFLANLETGGTASASLLIMNDGTDLFLAVKVQRSTVGSTSVGFEFDSNRNAMVDHGDEIVLLNPSVGFVDAVRWSLPPCPSGVICGFFDTTVGGTSDGAGAVRTNQSSLGAFSFYELSHPLNSVDDAHDFSLTAGDSVPFTMSLRFCGPTGCYDTDLPDPRVARYYTLVIAPAP